MANTFELIASSTVGSGGVSSIDFNSIPGTYTDLCIKISARKTDTSANIRWTINGTSTGYSERMLYNADGTVYSTSAAASGYFQFLYATPSNYRSDTFSNADIYIPNYAGSTHKTISVDNAQENNTTSIVQNITVALWSNTAAITSLSFGTASGNIAQYSTAYLYGVKNA
jgi:hypothetical protein